MPNSKWNDELILKDALACQQELTNTYNLASNETAGNNGLRSDLLHILMEEHELQSAMFNWARKKGWIEDAPASAQQIEATLSKYNQAEFKLH
ncbi:MAG: spore coat protein [Firmicutes bacterium]|nr:spore coat protein [Bacillota bacterium]